MKPEAIRAFRAIARRDYVIVLEDDDGEIIWSAEGLEPSKVSDSEVTWEVNMVATRWCYLAKVKVVFPRDDKTITFPWPREHILLGPGWYVDFEGVLGINLEKDENGSQTQVADRYVD